ncbi:hypothetical protein D3P07_14160 [Paenibacillus sp. 1011MAR3C5]|uniref:hypothetical protein n=1 Tax=Paenibacillus sp. 1011MAR3C5 TaxID=1675787 RepID=UPI000E6C7018|nr:hypothetical protein [Paenibacillus sp. 1011MAR3C5]RJE87476.1 hypothetical protein D3P07_14160 [Paenibacillus sp. 1011MAR3C5]
MNKKTAVYLVAALAAMTLALSACGAATNNQGASPSSPASGGVTSQPDQEILIVIDQTDKPVEGNMFDFAINKAPEGFQLKAMEWKSDKSHIKNTVAEAAEHGGNGEDGFYISGNGQFSGFIYPDSMKGEEGEVIFTFTNEKGQELTWKKNITLK